MALSGPSEPRLQEARFQALLKLLPAVLFFSFADALFLIAYFWSEVDHSLLLAWLGLMLVHSVFWTLFVHRCRRSEKPSSHKGRWMNGLSVSEACLFSLFLFLAFPVVPSEMAVLLTAFATGLLAAGSLSKMSMPVPALVFLTAMTIGGGAAVVEARLPSPWIVEIFLATFAVALGSLVLSMSKVFDARVKAEEELDRQKTLVSHLLQDFQESASEGLWETDIEGRLTAVSARLAQLLGTPPEALASRRFLPGPEGDAILAAGVPFRNLTVALEIGDGHRWWALTGKPLKDPQGRITGWRGVGSDITGSRLQELELIRLSRQDGLTGMLNRQSFRSLLDELSTAGALSRPRGLALVDLVDFKDVNESRGHAFGDALLVAVALRLRQVLPESVLVARLDGDEFALLFPLDGSVKDTKKAVDRLLEALKVPFTVLGNRFAAGFRIGASFAPQDASTPEQWLRSADLALRTAKSRGRNQLVFFTPDLMTAFRRRKTLRDDLKEAIGEGELWVAFQPLVDLSRNKITGFEALVRWNHPEEGAVPPSDFIPLAEESELILTLGLWVLEAACREALGWPEDVAVSVNVSGVQLRVDSLAEDVHQVLARLDFDPRRLVLEVTESALVKDNPTVGQNLAALKAQGIRLALDDFGTGYSALSYLQSFPFDKLKIDQSFVSPLSSRRNSPALLGSIVSLARTLGLSTTAEGIENDAQRAALRSVGCDEGQGYLFSPPVPASQIPALLGAVHV